VLFSWHRLRRPLPPASRASLLLLAAGLVFPPGWHHYFAFLPFALATALGRGRPVAVGLATAGFLASALPVVLLADVPGIYFRASAWGATTVAALAAWLALVVDPGDDLRPRTSMAR
jgi:hypothetical protein